jgi:[FeFe] hydrogenase H-cluster maturation GTPase HydF
MSDSAPRGVRLVITLVGRRNVGKSSLINSIVGQNVAIASSTPGTTTDPVLKQYELLPFGPVTFYDTAGLDDEGDLGQLRISATKKVLMRTDVAIAVIGENGVSEYERKLIDKMLGLDLKIVAAFNKSDLSTPSSADINFFTEKGIPTINVSAADSSGIKELKDAVMNAAPQEMKEEPVLAGDLFDEGDQVVCVVPIDLAAPKGRLILPQVQVLREILDRDASGIVVKERELEAVLGNMRTPPALVITDSQVVLSVAGDVPEEIPLTTFSTLFARYKGDIFELVSGAEQIDKLKDGDSVLMCESCSHHPVADDIGRVKIPRWIKQYTGRELNFDFYAGHDFPDDLGKYSLAVHCGGCMTNRHEVLRRIRECKRRNVPVTNYGVCISKVQGLLERVIKPFSL